MKALLGAALLGLVVVSAQETSAPDGEGFIRDWLVLAPIALGGDSGATEIDRSFLKGEEGLKPKAGDKLTIAGREVTWQAHKSSDFFIDFLKDFGKDGGEYVVGYAVAYLHAAEDTKATLALSTNDQGKAWLNGREVFKFAETRVLEKDTDKVEVALTKGQNVLVLKVINEVNNWQACARFLKDGAPVKTLKVALTPQ